MNMPKGFILRMRVVTVKLFFWEVLLIINNVVEVLKG